MDRFPEKLRTARKEKELNQTELAQAVGLTQRSLTNYECGRAIPRPATIRKLAENTEVTIVFVTHYTEEIMDVFSNCLLLKDGRIYAKDRTENVFNSETMSAFLNYPVEVSWQNQRIQVRMEVDSRMQELLQRTE